MNCFENMSMPSCVWFESGEKRNIIASIASGILHYITVCGILISTSNCLTDRSIITMSGLLATIVLSFFAGWWFIIDAAAVYPGTLPNAAHVCGVLATLSLVMVNSVSNAQVRGETYTGGCMGPRSARLWLFCGFVVGFASLIAACWILFANYVNAGSSQPAWPGVGLFMQNAFIFAASLVFKFGRTEDLWG